MENLTGGTPPVRYLLCVVPCKLYFNKIKNNLFNEKGITLELSSEYYSQLHSKASSNLVNGGRGIGNMVESVLINPLSRILVMKHIEENSTLVITGLNEDGSLSYNIERGGDISV